MTARSRGAPLLVALSLIAACAGGGGGDEPTPVPVEVTTASLPAGTTGVAYAATLSATGGAAPYTWSVSAGSLPAGLSLGTDTGVLSGTPSAAGSATFTARAADSSSPQRSATRGLSIAVADPLVVTTTSLPSATIGVAYSATLAGSGGTTPYVWSITSGTLPAGLSFNGATGAISGTPTAAGTSTLTFRVADAASPQRSATKSLSIAVATPTVALAITTTALPLGATGQAYGVQLEASGGTGSRTWSVVQGWALPAGLTLSSGGLLSGTPTTATQLSVRVQVSDQSSPVQVDMAELAIEVRYASLLTATTGALPLGATGQVYDTRLEASGGTGTKTWSVVQGWALPAGLTLAPGGQISGTPTTATQLNVRFQVSDQSSPVQVDYADLTIEVRHAAILTVTTSALPLGTTGQAYSAELEASGGTGTKRWSLVQGWALPAGLTLAPGGQISGTPTTATQLIARFQVSDQSSPVQIDYADLTIEIRYAAILTATTSALPDGKTGQAYAAQLEASGSTGTKTWSVAQGWALPDGLTLASGGQISGAPTTATQLIVRFQVSDQSLPMQTDYADLLIRVDDPSLAITTTRVPAARAGATYGLQLVASGGTAPHAWSVVSGAPPPGLTLSSGGLLSGTPASEGYSTFTVQVTDASSPTQVAAASLTAYVQHASILAVTTARMPTATAGAPYGLQLVAAGGTGLYAWSLASGTLPPGLALSGAGLLSGTPTSQGFWSFQVQVSDGSSPAQTRDVSLGAAVRYASELSVSTARMPTATAGAPYSLELLASGGTAPYTWSVTSGNPPPGLTLSQAGLLSGTPTSQGYWSFQVQVSDGSSPAQTRGVSLGATVRYASILAVATSHLPWAEAGAPYSVQLAAAGGAPPYTWSLAAGHALPAGLTLGPAGVISGTPTAAGGTTLVIDASDGSTPPQHATATLFLEVR